MIVARIEDEVTVKRFKVGSKIELHAENPEFSPIIVDLREQFILWKD